jgi:hypothetical protein
MTRHWRISVLPLVSLLALATALTTAAAASRQIALRPSKAYPAARGTAQYQQQPTQREFQIEVEHIPSLARHRVVVFVNETMIGTARVSSRGVAELERNTERRQRVPKFQAGTTVKVRTRDGRMIISGRF